MFRKILAPILALTMACTTPASERDYTREIMLRPPDLDHPADVNTDYALALSESFGHLNENLGSALDGNRFRRFGNVAANIWVSAGLAYFSHEMGHAYSTFDTDNKNWEFDKRTNPMGLPRIKFKSYITTLENEFREIAGGLNQNEANAQSIWERTDTITLDRALSFLAFKLDDSTYNFMGSMDDFDRNSPRQIKFYNRIPGKNEYVVPRTIPRMVTDNDLDKIGAIYEYLELPLGHGSEEIERRSLVADFATTRTWESLWAIWRYLRSGERTTNPLVFDFAGHRFSPPYVGSFLTTRGVFYNMGIDIDGDKFFVGRNVDLPDWRVGFNLNKLGGDCFYVSPFASFGRFDGRDGFSTGTDVDFKLTDNASIIFTIQKTKGDIIQDVRTVADGADVQVKLKVSW